MTSFDEMDVRTTTVGFDINGSTSARCAVSVYELAHLADVLPIDAVADPYGRHRANL